MNRWNVALLGFATFAMAGCSLSTSTYDSPVITDTPGPGVHIKVTLSDFTIKPAQITAASGVTTFDVINNGPTPHNFTVTDETGRSVAATRLLNTGKSQMLTVTLSSPAYKFLCTQPGHASLGMTGAITTKGTS